MPTTASKRSASKTASTRQVPTWTPADIERAAKSPEPAPPRRAARGKAGRQPLGAVPMSQAEKQRRYRQSLVTFKPHDRAALEAEAEARGLTVEALVASVVQEALSAAG